MSRSKRFSRTQVYASNSDINMKLHSPTSNAVPPFDYPTTVPDALFESFALAEQRSLTGSES